MIKISICLMLIFGAVAFATTRPKQAQQGPFTMPSPKPSPNFEFKETSLGWDGARLENKEVICYHIGHGLSCYWKPIDEVDSESEDSDYAQR